ncbi:MAG: putative DNA-binding domain-containing protein [Rhodospirillales bacterium]|nr:putative DNA-binding domain-containing protein [Rhodospirillales bacterium]
MSGLLDLQRRFRAALLGDAEVPPEVLGGMVGAGARLGIYRNNVIGNLTGALRLTYPAIERLVGAEFFSAAAGLFIRASPPDDADLYAYGADFADFLDGFAPARSLPYLADMARLEWAVNRALHAPPDAAIDAASLADLPPGQHEFLCFTRHPSLTLLALDHPVKAIWEAVLCADADRRAAGLAAIDLTAPGDRLAVLHGPEGLVLMEMSAAAFDFAEGLIDGLPLGDALGLAPEEEEAALLGGFIAYGFFSQCEVKNGTPRAMGGQRR